MGQLFALSVAVPPLAAAALLAVRPLSGHRRALDLVAVVTPAAVAVMLGLLLFRTDYPASYWFAGFRPAHGIAVGIGFTADPLSAGLACLGAVLMTASMLFLAGMTGFCLTADVFDLFVWFELMGVSAYALTAYRPEARG